MEIKIGINWSNTLYHSEISDLNTKIKKLVRYMLYKNGEDPDKVGRIINEMTIICK